MSVITLISFYHTNPVGSASLPRIASFSTDCIHFHGLHPFPRITSVAIHIQPLSGLVIFVSSFISLSYFLICLVLISYLLFIIYYLSFVIYLLSFVICLLLFAFCLLLFVFCYLPFVIFFFLIY